MWCDACWETCISQIPSVVCVSKVLGHTSLWTGITDTVSEFGVGLMYSLISREVLKLPSSHSPNDWWIAATPTENPIFVPPMGIPNASYSHWLSLAKSFTDYARLLHPPLILLLLIFQCERHRATSFWPAACSIEWRCMLGYSQAIRLNRDFCPVYNVHIGIS